MTFKEWLLNEDAPAAQFFYRLSLYPTDAFDGGEAFIDPKDVYALQQRWEVETKQGRKFHNLDKAEYLAKKFVTVHSNTMPDAKPGFWRHKGQDRPNLETKDTNLDYLGYSKSGQKPRTISKSNKEWEVPLDRIFGDRSKEPKSLDKSFDKPFKRMREDFTPFSDISQMSFSNKGMGIRSKYVGPDDTAEGQADEQKPTPVADFGFRKRRKVSYIRNNQGRPYGSAEQPDHYLQGQPPAGFDQPAAP